MPKPERRPSNPLIERAREAMGSRRAEPGDAGDAPATGEAASDDPARVAPPASRRPSELRRTVTEAGQKIQEIVDAAERVAEEIESEARAEADRYLADRVRDGDRLYRARAGELSDFTDGLVDRAEALRAEAEALSAEITRTVRQLRDAGTAATAPEARATPDQGVAASESASAVAEPAPPEVEAAEPAATPGFKRKGEDASPAVPSPVAYPGTGGGEAEGSEPESRGSDGVSEEALLRATQMAVAGHSRDEIEATLRSEFGVSDPSSVADEILGTG